MKRIARFTFILAAVACIPGWSAGDLQLGDHAPSIDADAVKGTIPQVGSGGVTIVEFWATWCAPCRQTVPHLTKIQRQYESQGVKIVGISAEDEDTIRAFVRRMGAQMDYAVAMDRNNATSNAYMGGFEVTSIPHAFIVDSEGRIQWHGHPGNGEMIKVLDKLTAD